jgi:hypothetical protein
VTVRLCTLFAWSAWAHPATVLAGSSGEGAASLQLFTRSAWDQPVIVVAGTKCEGAALASVLTLGVGLPSHCGSGHDS